MRKMHRLLQSIAQFPLILLLASSPLFAEALTVPLANPTLTRGSGVPDEGIRFSCSPQQLAEIAPRMDAYLSSLGISPAMAIKQTDKVTGALVYTLNTPEGDTNTLDLKDRAALHIQDEIVSLPIRPGKEKKRLTVSKKEIVLALLQHGRLTDFKEGACTLDALTDNVAVRQNIVAWAETLDWDWPDGGPAKWNNRYWKQGTPHAGVPLHTAIGDAFRHQGDYAIGCYTATKITLIQGVLDYYRRIKKDLTFLQLVTHRLTQGNDPLEYIEPGKMWEFETDFDQADKGRPGKLMKIEYGVAPKNFVPGDWIYILNTDPVSSQKTGYEGSNAIYLGRNKFDDYYNDNHHSFTYKQKVDEVYQWRNGVFSRSRDAAKIKPLSSQGLDTLSKSPGQGGIVPDIRVFPYFLGYEPLPAVEVTPQQQAVAQNNKEAPLAF